jgi:hypothetical protein
MQAYTTRRPEVDLRKFPPRATRNLYRWRGRILSRRFRPPQKTETRGNPVLSAPTREPSSNGRKKLQTNMQSLSMSTMKISVCIITEKSKRGVQMDRKLSLVGKKSLVDDRFPQNPSRAHCSAFRKAMRSNQGPHVLRQLEAPARAPSAYEPAKQAHSHCEPDCSPSRG